MASLFTRLAKLRRTWAILSGIVTLVVLPLGRVLWRRSKSTPPPSKKPIIDVTAQVIEDKDVGGKG